MYQNRLLACLTGACRLKTQLIFQTSSLAGRMVRVEVNVEPGKAIATDLAERGYKVQERDGENSGLHIIVVRPDELDGAADRRREGIVRTTSVN